jgi:hypothetical protein
VELLPGRHDESDHDHEPLAVTGGERTPTRDELAGFVRRALEAGSTVAVVDLTGSGEQFEPSRGAAGAWYKPDEFSVRDLAAEGKGVLDAGLALYPPPGPDTRRVIVLALDHGNWLPYDEALEHTLVELVNEWRAQDR